MSLSFDSKTPAKLAQLEQTYETLGFASVASLPMEMAETGTHFRSVPPENSGLVWRRVELGQMWGEEWATAWFRGVATVPPECAGLPLYLRAETGAPETLLLVDCRPTGSFDVNHPVRLAALHAQAGQTLQIHLEAYAGHSFPGTQPFDRPLAVTGGASQDNGAVVEKNGRRFDGVALVVERPDIRAFVRELRALRQLAQVLDKNSLRRGRVEAALAQVLAWVLAKPEEADESLWRPLLAKARRVMQPLLALANGPTAPKFGIIGHSHIDTAWLWPLAETERKLARTFSSVLSLMDQYPEFRFTQSAAYHSDVVRRLYPEIFERIKERVQEGRWEINGAMWIEPDCNIPGGEALVRQCLVGQQATREMFGVTSNTLWQPDVFGYSAALPQILRGCGVEFFCTTKLGWNDTNRFPYDTFTWQGMDGSTVLAHFNLIHCSPDPETLINAWDEVQHKDVQDRRLMTFGYGDGGGGPTAEMIEMARLTHDLEGCPKTEYAGIGEFMTGVRDALTDLPCWMGELYLELHRGTLTSAAALKCLNRRCELMLREAEFAGTLTALQGSIPYPAAALGTAWKVLLLHQFHDILPGTSIARVNDEAIDALTSCLAAVSALRDEACAALAGQNKNPIHGEQSVLIVNSLSWPREGEIEMAASSSSARPIGEGIKTQKFDDVTGEPRLAVIGLHLPPLGYAVVSLGQPAPDRPSPFEFDGETVETPFARVRLDGAGRISSFFDKVAGRELVSSGGAFNTLLMGEDVPLAWDNWDIDRDQRLKMIPQQQLVSRSVMSDGPLQLRLRQEYRLGRSSLFRQDLVFHAATARVDFDTVVDWHETHQLLKASFTLDVLADTARHEIQFGHVSRPTHDNTTVDRAQFDVCAHRWTDISETDYGVAFLNDSKYACTVKDGEYRLSLIKSGTHPDPRGDAGRHHFRYALLPHTGGFRVETVVRPAYEFNLPVSVTSAVAGSMPDFSLVEVDSAGVIVESVKWAEDSDGFILRLYEAGKTGTHARLIFSIPIGSIQETNLLEENSHPLAYHANTVFLYLRPFEIKTLRIRPSG